MIRPVLREACASARSQPVASMVTVLMVAGMILAVMLTTGRTVAAEHQVLGTIDAAGTRSVLIRAEDSAGVTADVLERIRGITGIEWAGAFSSAVDATNGAVLDGTRVPVRYAYGDQLAGLGMPEGSPLSGELAYASATALEQFGLPDIAGSITLTTGASYAVAGRITTPDYLAAFEPLVLIPQPEADGSERINVLVVIAERPDLVAPVSAAVSSVLAADDPSKVTVQTSEALAHLRSLIRGQLGTFSRGLVLALLSITGALVAVLLYSLVMMRRRDFGRRRALGASRGLIIGLLLMQTGVLALTGIALGTITATAVSIASRSPVPGISFTFSLALLALTTTLASAFIPAVVASRRDPIRELRVP